MIKFIFILSALLISAGMFLNFKVNFQYKSSNDASYLRYVLKADNLYIVYKTNAKSLKIMIGENSTTINLNNEAQNNLNSFLAKNFIKVNDVTYVGKRCTTLEIFLNKDSNSIDIVNHLNRNYC